MNVAIAIRSDPVISYSYQLQLSAVLLIAEEAS